MNDKNEFTEHGTIPETPMETDEERERNSDTREDETVKPSDETAILVDRETLTEIVEQIVDNKLQQLPCKKGG